MYIPGTAFDSPLLEACLEACKHQERISWGQAVQSRQTSFWGKSLRAESSQVVGAAAEGVSQIDANRPVVLARRREVGAERATAVVEAEVIVLPAYRQPACMLAVCPVPQKSPRKSDDL